MHWTALQPLRLGAEKRGRQKQLLQQQQLLFLWKKLRMKIQTSIFAKKLISDHLKGYIIFWSDQIQRSAKASKLWRGFCTLPSSVFRPGLQWQKARLALWHRDTFQMIWNNCSAFGVNLAHIWDSTTNSWEKFMWKSSMEQKQKLFCTAPIFEMQRITRQWIIISFELAAPRGGTLQWRSIKEGNTAGRSISIAPLHCYTGSRVPRLYWALSLMAPMTGSLQDPLSSDCFCRGLKKSAVASLVRDQSYTPL